MPDFPSPGLLYLRTAVHCSRPGCAPDAPCRVCVGIMWPPLEDERQRLLAAAAAEPDGPDRDALLARAGEIGRWFGAHSVRGEAGPPDRALPAAPAPRPAKTSERLIERLREAGQDLPPCTVLHRIGRNTKGRIGRWSWFAYCPLAGDDPEHGRHMNLHVGSHWSMAELLAAPGLTFQRLDSSGDICVDPADPEGR